MRWTFSSTNKILRHIFLIWMIAVSGVMLSPVETQAQATLLLQKALKGEEKPSTDVDSSAQTAEVETPNQSLESEMVEVEKDIIKELTEDVYLVRAALKNVFSGVTGFTSQSLNILRAQHPDGDLDWIIQALLVLVIGILGGAGAVRLYNRWANKQFLDRFPTQPELRADKIVYLLTRTLVMAVALVLFTLVSTIIILILDTGHPSARITGMNGLKVAALFLLVRLTFRNLLMPDASAYRLIKLSDETAKGLYISLIGVGALSALLIGFCAWMRALGLNADAHKLALISTSLFSMLALSAIALRYHRPISNIFHDPASDKHSPYAYTKIIARLWTPLLLGYLLIAWAISAIRILLDMPSAMGLVTAPIAALIIGLTCYAILVLFIDKALLPRLDSTRNQNAIAEDLDRVDVNAGHESSEETLQAQAQAEALEAEAARSPYRELLEHGARIMALIASAASLLTIWGVPLNAHQSILANTSSFGLTIFLGYMAYRAVEIAIEHQIDKSNGESPSGDDHEIGGAGATRLATLLPIFRNFLLITIVTISAMIALSEIGINIAPLFAGAGVVGLAVGFGSQTLIRDIFSGAFFLIDDAFRMGEYINIGDVKGTVEKISIRSMQLRHHNGPLNTVPFGNIKHVTNFSRDWAMMKLAFRVTYDTDVEKVRKLIKKFGQELLEHPDHGHKFLQPLKSQGVLALEDSAMIVRVKFMTKPGDQFELRKIVYAGIRDIFTREGIHFAHRQVTVRVADSESASSGEMKPKEMSQATKEAIAGAAVPLLEEGNSADGGSSADQR